MSSLISRRVLSTDDEESEESKDGGKDFFQEIVERMREDIRHASDFDNHESVFESRRQSGIASQEPVK